MGENRRLNFDSILTVIQWRGYPTFTQSAWKALVERTKESEQEQTSKGTKQEC